MINSYSSAVKKNLPVSDKDIEPIAELNIPKSNTKPCSIPANSKLNLIVDGETNISIFKWNCINLLEQLVEKMDQSVLDKFTSIAFYYMDLVANPRIFDILKKLINIRNIYFFGCIIDQIDADTLSKRAAQLRVMDTINCDYLSIVHCYVNSFANIKLGSVKSLQLCYNRFATHDSFDPKTYTKAVIHSNVIISTNVAFNKFNRLKFLGMTAIIERENIRPIFKLDNNFDLFVYENDGHDGKTRIDSDIDSKLHLKYDSRLFHYGKREEVMLPDDSYNKYQSCNRYNSSSTEPFKQTLKCNGYMEQGKLIENKSYAEYLSRSASIKASN